MPTLGRHLDYINLLKNQYMKYVELEEQKCGSKRLNADLPRSAQDTAQNELLGYRMDIT